MLASRQVKAVRLCSLVERHVIEVMWNRDQTEINNDDTDFMEASFSTDSRMDA